MVVSHHQRDTGKFGAAQHLGCGKKGIHIEETYNLARNRLHTTRQYAQGWNRTPVNVGDRKKRGTGGGRRGDTESMRFQTTAGHFHQACTTSEAAAKNSGNIEIAAGETGIHATGGDGEIGIRSRIEGTVEIEGSVICHGKPVISYTGAMTSETPIEVSKEGVMLHIAGGGRVYRFAVIDQLYLPVEEPGEGAHVVGVSGLSDLYSAVRHAIDPRHPVVKCVCADGKLSMYATDMYRGAAAERGTDSDGTWTVLFPSFALTTALRQHPHTLRVDPRGRIAAFYSSTTLTSVRLAASEFPSIEGVLAQRGETVWELPSVEMMTALRRISSVAGGEALRIEIGDGELCIHAQSGEGAGVEYVQVAGEGAGSFAVSSPLLIDAIEAVGGETARLHYQDSRKALHITGGREHETVSCVVMPVVR